MSEGDIARAAEFIASPDTPLGEKEAAVKHAKLYLATLEQIGGWRFMKPGPEKALRQAVIEFERRRFCGALQGCIQAAERER